MTADTLRNEILTHLRASLELDAVPASLAGKAVGILVRTAAGDFVIAVSNPVPARDWPPVARETSRPCTPAEVREIEEEMTRNGDW